MSLNNLLQFFSFNLTSGLELWSESMIRQDVIGSLVQALYQTTGVPGHSHLEIQAISQKREVQWWLVS